MLHLAESSAWTIRKHFNVVLERTLRELRGEPCLELDEFYTLNAAVVYDNQPVMLTSHEYRLLEYLMYRPGRLISRTELIEHIYAQDFDRDSNTIEVFVGRLRNLQFGSLLTRTAQTFITWYKMAYKALAIVQGRRHNGAHSTCWGAAKNIF